MSEIEYVLDIECEYSPKNIPMEKLAQYMDVFAKILGDESYVRFSAIEDGCVAIAASIEAQFKPEVDKRLASINFKTHNQKLAQLVAKLNFLLDQDNADAFIKPKGESVIIAFKHHSKQPSFGPLHEDCTLEGRLIDLGGLDETINITLRDGTNDWKCETSRTIALQMREHLLEDTILRVHGHALWIRTHTGEWRIAPRKRFWINNFEMLEKKGVLSTIKALQTIGIGEWRKFPDPIKELIDYRQENDEGDK